MPERREFPTLAERTKILLANSAMFYAAFVAATGQWLPTGGLESVWLLSGISLWLLSLLSAPWFVPLYRTRFFGHKFELSGLLHSGFLPGDTCVVRTA
jgi:hypothetical protein